MNIKTKAIFNILANGSNAFLLLISSVILVRFFSKDTYGTYLQIILIANTVAPLCILGLPQSIYYFYPKAVHKKRFLLRTIAITIGMAIIGALLTYWGRIKIGLWLGNVSYCEFGAFTSFFIVMQIPSFLLEPILLCCEKQILNAAVRLFFSISFFGSLYIAVFLRCSLEQILLVHSLVYFVNFLIFIGIILFVLRIKARQRQKNPDLGDSSARAQFSYSLPIGLSTYIGTFGKELDKFVVSAAFDPAIFAVYSRGAIRVPFIGELAGIIHNILMPRYVEYYQNSQLDRLMALWHESMLQVAVVTYGVFTFLFVMAGSTIQILYTAGYSDAAMIFRLYLVPFLFTITIYGMIFSVSGKTKYFMWFNAGYMFVNIVLNVALIRLIGSIGAAVAVMLTSIVLILGQLCIIKEQFGVSFAQVMPWKKLGKLLLLSILSATPMYVFCLCFGIFESPKLTGLAVAGVIFTSSYVLLLLRCGFLQQESLSFLRNLIPMRRN